MKTPLTSRSFTLSAAVLRALACLATEKDTRKYIEGVYVDVRRDGARVVATDGAVMGAMFVPRESNAADLDASDFADVPGFDTPQFVPWACLVPLHVIKLLPKVKRYAAAGHVTLSLLGRPNECRKDDSTAPEHVYTLSIECGGLRQTVDLADERYPDYVRVMPTRADAAAAPIASHLDLSKLAKFVALAKALDRVPTAVTVHQRGNVAALIGLSGEEFIGLIMPLRSEAVAPLTEADAPLWLTSAPATLPTAEAIAA